MATAVRLHAQTLWVRHLGRTQRGWLASMVSGVLVGESLKLGMTQMAGSWNPLEASLPPHLAPRGQAARLGLFFCVVCVWSPSCITTVLKSGREGAKELGRGGRNSKQERDSVRCCCGVEDGGRKTTQMQLVTRSWEEPPGDYSSQSYNRNSRILPTLK